MSRTHLLSAALVLFLATQAHARKRGIVGQPAPDLDVTEWVNTKAPLDLAELRGKVVYLSFFQSWCPGCHKHGLPTLKAVAAHYEDDEGVVFLAVQTVFEGFETNTAAAALETAVEHGLDVPVGHDARPRGKNVMSRYRSGGTPWTVIVDRKGVVRFNGFRIAAARAVRIIEALR
jgi:thiol-disulfide isomerase/thioredoxin